MKGDWFRAFSKELESVDIGIVTFFYFREQAIHFLEQRK